MSFWEAREPMKLVYSRPDNAYRIQYNDIMWNQISDEIGVKRPIYNTLEDGIMASIEKCYK